MKAAIAHPLDESIKKPQMQPFKMVGVAQLVRAPGCGPGGRGFKSLHSPHFCCAPVAQLDRAPDFGSGGREFESLRAHQFSLQVFPLLKRAWSNFKPRDVSIMKAQNFSFDYLK